MDSFVTLQQIDETAQMVRAATRYQPAVGLILGSGLGDLADMVEDADVIPTAAIPNWPVSTVLGHQGRLVIGRLGGQVVLVLQGRTHYYEGYSMDQVTLPVRVMQRLGIGTLFVTNAAGAIRPEFLRDLWRSVWRCSSKNKTVMIRSWRHCLPISICSPAETCPR